MPDAGEQPALADDDAAACRNGGRRQKLERDLAIEPRVPRAIHLAEGAAADPFQDAQVAPGLAFPGQRLAVHLGHRRHEPEVPNERPDVGISARLGGAQSTSPPSRTAPAISSSSCWLEACEDSRRARAPRRKHRAAAFRTLAACLAPATCPGGSSGGSAARSPAAQPCARRQLWAFPAARPARCNDRPFPCAR